MLKVGATGPVDIDTGTGTGTYFLKQLASLDKPDNRPPVLRQGQVFNREVVDHRRLSRGSLNCAFMAYSDTWLLRRSLTAKQDRVQD